MATLIPALGACVSRMTAGERRLAERLEHKLDDDYLLWYDVPMGPRNTHPGANTIKVITMHARKSLEFPVIALVGAGQMPAAGEDERDEARLFYVAATRATQ